MLDATSEQTRVCIHCVTEQPITEFRRRGANSELRFSTCRLCYNAYSKRYAERRRLKKLGQFMDRTMKLTPTSRHLDLLCASVMRAFGGPERFATEWKRQIEAAQAIQSGHRYALKSLATIAALVTTAAELRQRAKAAEAEAIDNLSDAELDALIKHEAKALFGSSGT